MKWSFKRLTHRILPVERATHLQEHTMSDNLRRYRAIRDALAQCYPTSSQGNFARHLNTLAALISGIVGSKSSQLPHMATKVPDGSSVGRGGTALMIHVVSKGRALPLAWRVRQAPKGHCPKDLPIALVTLIR